MTLWGYFVHPRLTVLLKSGRTFVLTEPHVTARTQLMSLLRQVTVILCLHHDDEISQNSHPVFQRERTNEGTEWGHVTGSGTNQGTEEGVG